MGQFGDQLRKEREERGISLDTISQATKISTRHLEALEGERFADLPGGVFNKGIVRGYARVVGLEEEAWLERYNAAFDSSGLTRLEDADWVNFSETVGQKRLSERLRHGPRPDLTLRWAGVAVLLLLVVGLGWFVWTYIQQRIVAGNHTRGPQYVLTDHALSPRTRSLQPAPAEQVNVPLG